MGIESLNLNGNRVENIYIKSKKLIETIRKKQKPFLIELSTYRFLEHCGPNNDDSLNYRSKEEIALWQKKCPIKNYKKQLITEDVLTLENLNLINKKIELEISASFNFAKKSKFPKSNQLMKNIFA